MDSPRSSEIGHGFGGFGVAPALDLNLSGARLDLAQLFS
jgi:hypothetical protein